MLKSLAPWLGVGAIAIGIAVAGVTGANAAEHCDKIDCSGRHIKCKGVGKVFCEVKKSEWKARCEISKVLCNAATASLSMTPLR
jgi:hypothetical protein